VKILGRWAYLCRAVDRDGSTVDFRLSTRRDVIAAKAFFCKAIKVQGTPPRSITLDGYAASNRAVRDMQAGGQLPTDTKLRLSTCLNNLIEQDHRSVKLRIGPMLEFKRFETAAITIAGIELLRRIHKGQFISAGCVSRVEARPPSLMRCWRRNKAGRVGRTNGPALSFSLFAPNPPIRRCIHSR
jgi:transposase-like protein